MDSRSPAPANSNAPAAQPLCDVTVARLRGVGPRLAEKLAALDIHSVQDLLFHLPLHYQDRTRVTPIAALMLGVPAVIAGEVRSAEIAFGRRRSLVVRVQDDSGTATLRFFHFSAAQQQALKTGARLRAYGEARRGAHGMELYHPEYRLLEADDAPPSEERLTPIYPSTEGFSQTSWRKLCQQALALLDRGQLQELLPLRNELTRIGLAEAIRYLHAPPADASLTQLRAGQHPCQQRLAFEELLAHRLSLQQFRHTIRQRPAPALRGGDQRCQHLLTQLPFALTGAQRRALNEIERDLAQPQPMLRLLQGDVGSGKTVVAALAALRAAACGHQVAVMAPTELLAQQHLRNFRHWLQPLDVEVAWLSSRVKGAERTQTLAAIADGRAAVVVGTHALFQDAVQFHQLGLVIIDEQHRFGVQQRLALQDKGRDGLQPHQLVMTATPIPRTLAMSAYADLDTSVIDELPPGRTPITTVAIDNQRRADIVARIQNACAEGRQAYWVCTLIEESDLLTAQAAEQTREELAAALPQLRVGLVHGRLKETEKAQVMAAFSRAEIDVLVATTVIEVGVDVPNASLMIIENAERLGLAQLHQLRGRVGRGSTQSFCVLCYQAPLSALARQRLQVLRDTCDGFVIAEQDLALRGPGELLGTRQTGLATLRIADLQRDAHLLTAVARYAEELQQLHPQCIEPLLQRWLPGAMRFAQV